MSTLLPTCPADCEGVLPEVNFNACAPQFSFGRLRRLYMGKADAQAFIDEADADEWTARLSNDGGADEALRPLVIVGSKPVPEYTELDLSDNRKVVTTKTHKLEFYIDEVTAENHEFMRALECGTQMRIWYDSMDYLWGGTEGILVSVKLDEEIPESDQELYKFKGTCTWKSKFSPNRIANPLT